MHHDHLARIRATAQAISESAHRDLHAYWSRRKLEGRPNDLT